MQFRKGLRVYSADPHEIGRITRVVLNPDSKQVTHIVVRRGGLFSEDRVIPIEWFDAASTDQMRLREKAITLESLAKFQTAQPMLVGGDGSVAPANAGAALDGGCESPPDDSVALREGARVTSKDDEFLGHIDAVIIDRHTDCATHFVIEQGLLWKMRKRVPTFWCGIVAEDEVQLTLVEQEYESLPEYALSDM